MQPPPNRRAEEAGDEPAGQDPERHRQRQREAALGGVEDRRRVRLVVREVVEDVAKTPTGDRAGHRADDDEDHVVEAEAGRRHVRPDGRGDEGHPRGEREPEEQDDPECDRLDADRRRVAELDDRVEGERDDPERHGAECSRRSPSRMVLRRRRCHPQATSICVHCSGPGATSLRFTEPTVCSVMPRTPIVVGQPSASMGSVSVTSAPARFAVPG